MLIAPALVTAMQEAARQELRKIDAWERYLNGEESA